MTQNRALATANRLSRRIAKLAKEDGHYYEQCARIAWDADRVAPMAYLRREDWRRCWWLSETALLAEAGTLFPFNGILWDTPARDVILHYAKEAS